MFLTDMLSAQVYFFGQGDVKKVEETDCIL